MYGKTHEVMFIESSRVWLKRDNKKDVGWSSFFCFFFNFCFFAPPHDLQKKIYKKSFPLSPPWRACYTSKQALKRVYSLSSPRKSSMLCSPEQPWSTHAKEKQLHRAASPSQQVCRFSLSLHILQRSFCEILIVSLIVHHLIGILHRKSEHERPNFIN
jgi:hypothetical protein